MRTVGSSYYKINPSGRMPYLDDDAGVGMEESQLICAYLDSLDGKPRFHRPLRESDWDYRRLEATRAACAKASAIWVREMSRPENERWPPSSLTRSRAASGWPIFLRHGFPGR